jgi:sulfur carrier protein
MTSAPELLRVQVNDSDRTVPQGTRLLSLLEEMALAGRLGLAVALNAAVVPRVRWADQKLHEGDRILIIQASQGG